MAASCDIAVTIVTPGLSAGGFNLQMVDRKFRMSVTNTDPSDANDSVVNMTLAVTLAGSPLVGASVTVTPDATVDGEGNRMIGFSTATMGNLGESPVPRIATTTTGAGGQFVVRVATATYGLPDCGFTPRSGTFTVTVAAPCGTKVLTFSYRVIDGGAISNCP